MSGECSCSYFMNTTRLRMDVFFPFFGWCFFVHIIQIALPVPLMMLQHKIRWHEINAKTPSKRHNSHDFCTWPAEWRNFSFPALRNRRNFFHIRPTPTKSLVVAITYPNNNYIMQVMKMSERNWITSIRFATKLVKSFSQRTSTFRSTNSINASLRIHLDEQKCMFVWTRAQTKWTRKKRRTKISTSVFVCTYLQWECTNSWASDGICWCCERSVNELGIDVTVTTFNQSTGRFCMTR